ncbi:MAG: hypothetical protein Q8K85_18980, partial [Hyphomicrobium sp.]|nr:hypothetical protein [Hyphomicrobium sp.]
MAVIPKPKAEESAFCVTQKQIPRCARNDNLFDFTMPASSPSEFISVYGRRLEYRRIAAAAAGPTLVF